MFVTVNNPLLAAGAAGTVQLLRMSMEFVVAASGKTQTSNGGKPQKPTKAFFEKGPAYGSVPQSEEDVENGDKVEEEEEAPPTALQLLLPKISLVMQLSMAIYFGTVGYFEKDSWMVIISVTLLLGAILVFRDLQRQRFGFFQRSFQLITSLAAFYSSLDGTHIIAPILLGLYVVLTGLEAYIAPYPSAVSSSSGKRLSRRAILVLLKPYFWPDATSSSAALNRLRAILTWLCVILSKVANLVSPILLGRATTALSRGEYGAAIEYTILYAAIGFVGSTLKEGQSLIYLKVAQAAFVQLSEVAFSHLHSLSLDWHLKKKLGEVLRSMDRGIAACDTLMKYLFLWLVPAIAECLVVCVIFATYFSYWPLGVAVFYFVFAYIVWTIMVTLWRKKFRKAVVQSDNEWHDRCTDSLINFETVKYFTAENYEMKRFSESVKRYQSGSVDVQASLSFLNISQRLLLQACLATALSLSARAIQLKVQCCVEEFGCEDGNSQCCTDSGCPGMEVGDFVAVLTYTIQLFTPLNFLGSVYNAVVMAVIDLTNLSELLAESPDVVDAPDAIPLPPTNETDPDIAVEFDNVVFHYPTQPSNKGLKGLSFKMKKGTTTAIVGSTGAGKTTVSRLLFRFYDVLGGAVKVNGVDVRTVTQTSLRGALGVVPQAASMFNDTLRANVLYGRREATEEDLNKAAEQAQLTTFISSLDSGWETLVGDRGLKLSGGEKQRTAIARCLLKNPPFVLLDEATSALDTITENSVQEALDSLGRERTVLVIAHRLGTIRNADNIIVLRDGVVHEQGTHDELLDLKGEYAEMWNMQLNSTKGSHDAMDALEM